MKKNANKWYFFAKIVRIYKATDKTHTEVQEIQLVCLIFMDIVIKYEN
jgi:hypothetical protein